MTGFSLQGRTALVTGGNRGIGLGIALGLAEAGASVVVAARDDEKNAGAVEQIIANGGQAVGVCCDVRDTDDVEAAVKTAVDTFGGLDIVVANAGYGRASPPADEADEAWEAVLDTNLSSVFRLCKAAYPLLFRSSGASVIMTSSGITVLAGGQHASYGASKAGLEGLTKSLAVAWAGDGIRVNAIRPGFVWSDITAGFADGEPLAPYRAAITSRVPLGRFADPSEMAGPVVFLASDAASYVTGTTLTVDGGITINLGL